MSDLGFCDPGEFSDGVVQACRPDDGGSGYVASATGKSVYAVDINTGISSVLFTDPNVTGINSLAYDVDYHRVYYAEENFGQATLKFYDLNTGTFTTLISSQAQAEALGIEVFDRALASSGGAIDGRYYYFGVESSSNGKDRVYRASLNTNGSIDKVWQVREQASEWGDFIVANGVLYDSASNEIEYYSLYTGDYIGQTNTGTNFQLGTSWNGNLYGVDTFTREFNPTTGVITQIAQIQA
ncbi:hypothetical protein N9K16_04555, partial [Alphaproteobacteria bacterium]|nr:hypothetical protein [Alphaproteobacteria bacterium]